MTERKNNLISVNHCRIQDSERVLIPDMSWTMTAGQAWLVIGPNGGGKAAFLTAISGVRSSMLQIIPNSMSGSAGSGEDIPLYASAFEGSVEIVSLERAARLIEEERINDESDYIEGGVDHGRTGRRFLAEVTGNDGSRLESDPQVKLCGVDKILDRGLKYMSTGEIRRTLLCRALLSGKKLLILSDPFAGLDSTSRGILLDFFNTIASKQVAGKPSDTALPYIILGMERYTEIPACITHVLELKDGAVSFCGTKDGYESELQVRQQQNAAGQERLRSEFAEEVRRLHAAARAAQDDETASAPEKNVPLVEMHDVNVGWDDHKVLRHLSWTLYPGEHWLIRGPNGSGKTTFLELITGDNMQVFSNDVSLFGRRRGSGETIWEIKAKLGIVSYRLHVEYRMVGGDLESVIISGFRDSIGLYEHKTDSEIASARKWLRLGGFAGREQENFADLSYGEQRAVLILRAAVKCPPLLILDEPCHGLDESYRQKILDLLETVAATGTTTLLHVTHDPTEVLPCEHHVLELHPDEDPMYRILVQEKAEK